MEEPDATPTAGSLLIAPPQLIDPNFRRTVVFLCEHNDEGSFGLVLNRPLSIQLSEVLEGLENFADPLSLGGPVQPNTLHYLHELAEIPGAIPVQDGIFWGGDFDAIKDLIADDGLDGRELRFFLGYAGWSPEQLTGEIEQGGWIVGQADYASVFPENPERLWRSVLRAMGGAYAILANYPDDPRLN